MRRTLLTILAVVAGVALLTVSAMAQPPAGAKAGPPGGKAPLTKEQIGKLKQAHELHSKLRASQLDLLSLRVEEADQKKIDAKTEQISKLHEQIRELAAEHRPGIGRGRGMGRGPRGWREDPGAGGGPGPGIGRGPRGHGGGPGGGPGLGMGRGPRGWGGGPGARLGQRWQHGRGGGRGLGPGIGRRGGPGFGRGGEGRGCPAGRLCPYQ